MSASLVGSEMCIRDRFIAYDSDLDVGNASSCSLFSSSRFGISEARSCRPVSYTHLTLPTICSV
eukprot:3368160-Alexandrium_andersonii.AAC.1